ncbi:FAD-dependent oxidoreductase [Rugosimonospora acidiphila]|uniref:FAD-dependent oxidoreductase n=1 Tax=Rugosimonospora acidiphila TaxID=556531 RepID=A0ABP9RUJ1_9ACTN
MGRTNTVVVGGGCTGVLAAVRLLCHGTGDVTMVEPSPALGSGVAYGTCEPMHLLNSPADTMSADPDEPGQFAAWAARHANLTDPAGFAARRDYGRYLAEALDAAAVDHPGRFTHVRGRAGALRAADSRIHVVVDGARALRAQRVILAIGHASPRHPRPLGATLTQHPGYVADPWRPGALDAVPPDAPVLLVGTGLTAVDVAMSLAARGQRAPIHAVSRHGLLPLAHGMRAPQKLPARLPATDRLSALLRQLRADAAAADDWRSVVDGLRPHADAVWNGLSLTQRRTFLRHLHRYWEIHRHRMAPTVGIAIRGMVLDGALRPHAARLDTVAADGAWLIATAASGAHWRVATIVNCTGPASAIHSALGRDLLSGGLARMDPLGLGFDVDVDGRLVSEQGQAHHQILVAGPPRRGQWWETTAVPEIRTQVQKLSLLDMARATTGSGARTAEHAARFAA